MSTNTNANAASALPATLGELRDSGYETAPVRGGNPPQSDWQDTGRGAGFPRDHRL